MSAGLQTLGKAGDHDDWATTGKIPLFARAELIEPDIESLKAPNIRGRS